MWFENRPGIVTELEHQRLIDSRLDDRQIRTFYVLKRHFTISCPSVEEYIDNVSANRLISQTQ
jgi:hypothetical protein